MCNICSLWHWIAISTKEKLNLGTRKGNSDALLRIEDQLVLFHLMILGWLPVISQNDAFVYTEKLEIFQDDLCFTGSIFYCVFFIVENAFKWLYSFQFFWVTLCKKFTSIFKLKFSEEVYQWPWKTKTQNTNLC